MPKPKRKPKPRPTPRDPRRAGRILLERGSCTARECAERHGVTRWTVLSIWHGRRMPGLDRSAVLMMVQKQEGAWIPASVRDERTLDRVLGSLPLKAGGLASLVGLAAEHGLAVVFRGDLEREDETREFCMTLY